jgi:DNA modification methylase
MSKIEIFNEDCYQAIKKIPDKSIDLIYTDIPYDLEGNGGGGCFGSKKRDYHKEYEKVSENTNASKISQRKAKSINFIKEIAFGIDYAILDEYVRVMKKINIYIWCSKKQIPTILNYFLDKNCYWELFTWHKTNPIPTCNNTYLSDTEYCLIFRESGTNIYGTYETKSKYYISEINKKDKDLYGHPTIKPLEVVKNHITNSTQIGGVVLDTFLGSGTTAVACKELDRNFIGFELNKEYYEIAVDRVNGISQVDRKLEEQGQMMLF